MEIVYTAKPGERVKLLPNGNAVVVHPEHPPRILEIKDGKVQIDRSIRSCGQAPQSRDSLR